MEDALENKATARRNRLFTMAAVAIGIVVGAIGGGPLAEWLHRDRASTPAHFGDTSWESQTLNDITLEAPLRLEPGQSAEQDMPEEIRNGVAAMEVFQAEREGVFYVFASRIRYKESVEISLEGAVQGGMFHAAAAMGDEKPEFDVKPFDLGGRDARRTSYRQLRDGRIVRIEGVFAHEHQQFWSVQVIYVGDEAAPAAARILDSVKIARSTL